MCEPAAQRSHVHRYVNNAVSQTVERHLRSLSGQCAADQPPFVRTSHCSKVGLVRKYSGVNLDRLNQDSNTGRPQTHSTRAAGIFEKYRRIEPEWRAPPIEADFGCALLRLILQGALT